MKTLITLSLILCFTPLFAFTPTWIKENVMPKSIKFQYAGNLGKFAGGLSYSFAKNKINTDIMLGYLQQNNSARDVHTLAVKVSGLAFKHDVNKNIQASFYGGMGVLYGFTHNTHAQLPDYYPEGYYPPTAFHLAPFLGHQFSYKIKSIPQIEKIGFYHEWGTLDVYALHAMKNRTLNLHEILNLAIGVHIILK